MTTNVHTDTARSADEREPLGQAEPPAAPPSAIPPTETTESGAARREAPPPATSPAPPGGGIVAWLQRMPLGGRWGLGLALAFLSGMAVLLSVYVGFGVPVTPAALGFAALFLLALAAGFVLSDWWAVLALTVAAAAGSFVAAWVNVLVSGGGSGREVLGNILFTFMAFAVLESWTAILFLLAGVGLGKLYGITLGQPHALSANEATVSLWIAALAPMIGAGYHAATVRFIPGEQFGVGFTVSMVLYAVVLSATCLLAAWLLRSWWGLGVAPVVYVGMAALASMLPWFGGGVTDWTGWIGGFLLYIVLPAVVMAAIGTAIGMFRGGQRGQIGQRPPYGRLAT